MCRFFSLRHSEQTLFRLLYTLELLLRLSLFNIYLLPLMSFQSAAPSHFWYHCPYPFLSIHLCPPRSPGPGSNRRRRRRTVCTLNLTAHIFCSAHPSLPCCPVVIPSIRPPDCRISSGVLRRRRSQLSLDGVRGHPPARPPGWAQRCSNETRCLVFQL